MKTRRTRPPNALDERTAVQLVELFDVFSDPSRVRLISVLAAGEQNVGAVAAAGLTGWLWLDPIIAIAVAINILWSAYRLLRVRRRV